MAKLAPSPVAQSSGLNIPQPALDCCTRGLLKLASLSRSSQSSRGAMSSKTCTLGNRVAITRWLCDQVTRLDDTAVTARDQPHPPRFASRYMRVRNRSTRLPDNISASGACPAKSGASLAFLIHARAISSLGIRIRKAL